MAGIRWLAVTLALSVPFAPRHVDPAAAQEAPLEYQIKAAFLLNFVRYVEWPSSAFQAASTPLMLCVLEPNPFEVNVGAAERRGLRISSRLLRLAVTIHQS